MPCVANMTAQQKSSVACTFKTHYFLLHRYVGVANNLEPLFQFTQHEICSLLRCIDYRDNTQLGIPLPNQRFRTNSLSAGLRRARFCIGVPVSTSTIFNVPASYTEMLASATVGVPGRYAIQRPHHRLSTHHIIKAADARNIRLGRIAEYKGVQFCSKPRCMNKLFSI